MHIHMTTKAPSPHRSWHDTPGPGIALLTSRRIPETKNDRYHMLPRIPSQACMNNWTSDKCPVPFLKSSHNPPKSYMAQTHNSNLLADYRSYILSDFKNLQDKISSTSANRVHIGHNRCLNFINTCRHGNSYKHILLIRAHTTLTVWGC
jgi:hypothetical protein